MNSLKIEIGSIGSDEKIMFIKNRTLILCIHKCLDKRNNPVFHILVYLRERHLFSPGHLGLGPIRLLDVLNY